MSESIIIALIGVIPSVLVAIVTILSNNVMIQKRLDWLESVASEYHRYEDKLQEIKFRLVECESKYIELREYISRVERKRVGRGRTSI